MKCLKCGKKVRGNFCANCGSDVRSFRPARTAKLHPVTTVLFAIGLYALFFFIAFIVFVVVVVTSPTNEDGTPMVSAWWALFTIAAPAVLTYITFLLKKITKQQIPSQRPVGNRSGWNYNGNVPPANFQQPKPQEGPVDLVTEMENAFAECCRYAAEHRLDQSAYKQMYRMICEQYEDMPLSVPVKLRFEQLKEQYRHKFDNAASMLYVDQLEGLEFEKWCADLLTFNGFDQVQITPGSGDQGVDLVAVKDGIRYAVQCKRYSSNLGNTPVQEVYAGKAMYNCQVGVVMTNQHFTSGAKELAKSTGVLLWDREKIAEMVSNIR